MTDRTTDRILYNLKSRGAQNAAGLAAQLDVTPVAIRQHLERLLDDGLVIHEDRRESVGRPKRFWRLTEAGHSRFPDRHSDLTVELLESIGDMFGEEGLEKVIQRRERQMLVSYAGVVDAEHSLEDRLIKLMERRCEEGYMAELENDGDGGFVFIENHCPICAAASICQGLCRSELEIFQKLFKGTAHWERTEHVLNGARRCAYSVKPVAGNHESSKRP